MDFTVKKDSISDVDLRAVSSAEHNIQCDVTLPEYMPDVVRILRCSLIPSIASQGINGDRISAECDCTVKLVYICEEGKIHCFEQMEHFGKQIELRDSTVEGISVTAKSEFANYRIGSNRKIEVNGAILLTASSIQKSEKEIVSFAEGDGMTVKCEKIKSCNLVGCGRKSFSVSETCEVNCSETIVSVISVSSSVRLDEVKTIHGKVFLRGELCVRSSCLTEDCDVLCFESAVGINQIVDVPDISDESTVQTDFAVNSISVRPRSERSGDRALLEIDADICVTIRAYDTVEISVIRDAYSTKYDTETDIRTININTSCEKLFDTFLCRETVDISPVGIRKILSFSCGEVSSNSTFEDGCITVSGTVNADCVFEDSNNEVYYVSRQIPFEYKHGVVYENVTSCDVSTTVSAYNYVTGSGGSIDTRIELCVSGLVFCGEETRAVTDITLDKTKCKTIKTASLTVYFAEESENIWDIARHYNTTVDAILRENRMQSEEITHSCKLLIPKV